MVEAESLPKLVPVPDTNVGALPKGAAVVVGIGKYRTSDAGELRYAAADADLVAQYLVHMTGIPQDRVWVVKDEDATKSTIMAMVQGKLSNKGYDPVVFYFAGHGTPDPDDPNSGESCIVPYDGNFHEGLSGTLIRLNDLTAMVEAATPGKALVVLDACFSGSQEGGRTPSLLGKERGIAIEPKIRAAKASVLSATSGKMPALDFDEQGHGFFTYFLLAGLQKSADLDNSGRVTLDQAFSWAREQVQKRTDGRQIPELKNPTDLVLSRWR